MVDVRVEPGYSAVTTAAMLRGTKEVRLRGRKEKESKMLRTWRPRSAQVLPDPPAA